MEVKTIFIYLALILGTQAVYADAVSDCYKSVDESLRVSESEIEVLDLKIKQAWFEQYDQCKKRHSPDVCGNPFAEPNWAEAGEKARKLMLQRSAHARVVATYRLRIEGCANGGRR